MYPALIPVTDLTLRHGLAQLGEKQCAARARSGDFHGLRELRPSDDPRDIHWRTSARRGRPFVREFEEEKGRTLVIILETRIKTEESESFETAVSYAASLSLVLLRRGFRVGLVAGNHFVAPDAGMSCGGQILRALALVPASSPDEPAHDLPPRIGQGAGTLTIIPAEGHPRIDIGTGKTARRIA